MKNLHVPCLVWFPSLFVNVYFPFFAGVGIRKVRGRQISCGPARSRQPKGSSTGTRSALDTGGQPVGGGAAAECLTTHSVLVLGISSAPHEGRESCLTAVRAGAQAVSTSPGAPALA